MNGILSNFLAHFDGQIAIAIGGVYCANILLTGLKKALAKIKDKTSSQADDKAYAVVDKILGYSDKAIEFVTANSVVLPPKAKAEVESGVEPSPSPAPAQPAPAPEQPKSGS